MVYVGPVGPVWLVRAPVAVSAPVPVLRHVGVTTAVSLGWYTPLPAVSTASASAAAARVGPGVPAPGKRYVMSSIQTPTSATELSEANRKRIITLRFAKSAMSTRTSAKVSCWFDHARRPPIGLPKLVLMVEL